MPYNPLISIITVNLNNLEGLQLTLSSVFKQTYQEFEYIVIDGGSNDGSKELIENNSGKIDFWLSEPDKGIYNAMNKGIEQASGKYLLFLNSGDHFFNASTLDENIKEISVSDIIYFNLQFIERQASFIRNYPEKLSFSYFYNDTLPHPSTFIKKELFLKYGLYNEGLKIASDWEFFLRVICRMNVSYKRIDAVLATFYIGGISSKPDNQKLIEQERLSILEKQYPLFLIDILENRDLKKKLLILRNSKKMKLLIKIGLLKSI